MDPFIGDIKLFAGNYAPEGWLLCNGAAMPLTQYEALYAVIGNTYGANIPESFNLPKLDGAAVDGQGGVKINYIIAITGEFPQKP